MILITEARYSGVYEGGPWAAFAVASVQAVPSEAFGADTVAVNWWSAPTVPVGVGDTPNGALGRLEFYLDRDQKGSQAGLFALGDQVTVARPTPDAWYGAGVGAVREVEFRPILPHVGGL